MFFDDHNVDEAYQSLLLSIAKKQQELLYFRFDWQNRVCKPWPPKGLFGKDKKAMAQYDALLQQLEQLKAATVAHRKKMGYLPGIFWWSLPWEQVEMYLMYDLQRPEEENGPWRFARKWELARQDDLYLLVLQEEGHCSDFSGKYSYHYEEISKYSSYEQDQMVRDYNKRLNNYELAQVMFDNDRPVRSVYGKTFATMTDYLYSGDHLLYRSSLEDSYRRSLYTEHHTNKVTVTSNSIHYKCIMAVAGVHLRRNGVPDYMDILNYDMVHSSGPVPDGVLDEYQQMDAAVAMAAYMADHSEFTAVPVQLFGRNIIDSAGTYSEAMRQSELYTCLAHKLQFID